MKFLADAHISVEMVAMIRDLGDDCLDSSAIPPRMPDVDVLKKAQAEARVVMTSDKDFGRNWFFVHRIQCPGVVLIRVALADESDRVAYVRSVWPTVLSRLPGSSLQSHCQVYGRGLCREEVEIAMHRCDIDPCWAEVPDPPDPHPSHRVDSSSVVKQGPREVCTANPTTFVIRISSFFRISGFVICPPVRRPHPPPPLQASSPSPVHSYCYCRPHPTDILCCRPTFTDVPRGSSGSDQ